MKIAVIDLDSVCYSIAHPEKVLDENGNPVKVKSKAGNMVFQYHEKTIDQMISDVDKILTMILTESGATHYIGFMKGNNTTLARLEVNPDYKGNRNKEEPWWWDGIQKVLSEFCGALYVDNMEVDDAVNITRLALPDSFICAIDGDLLGLEGTHYNWRKKEWITVSKYEAEKKFWCDMIAGQPGDNIKGLPGRGKKYFESLLPCDFIPVTVFQTYMNDLGVDEGVKEFYKNYFSLKILEKQEGFVVPEPRPFIIKQKEEHSDLFT